jgi:hypothetical protein
VDQKDHLHPISYLTNSVVGLDLVTTVIIVTTADTIVVVIVALIEVVL